MEQHFLEPPILFCFRLDQSLSYFFVIQIVILLKEETWISHPIQTSFKKQTTEVYGEHL